ncbi:hypothetical protein [Candidatus Hodgkinia cicadicola]|uniref:hypothetical protein n=1 Tax=Candidatus Hodgkinia cicadicola TaxID=573658 RepID=UPI001788E382
MTIQRNSNELKHILRGDICVVINKLGWLIRKKNSCVVNQFLKTYTQWCGVWRFWTLDS